MADIRISKNQTYFEKDGKPFFLLCDTLWMAFQKLSLMEWRELVRFRKEQGFDALQISVLPIAHDNSVGTDSVEPFCLKDGKYDFDHVNEAYFDRAEKMLQVMQEYEMIPFLHLFWVNYIPDTWAARKSPVTVIPFENIEGLTGYFLDRFDKYQPIYSVSGDTGFETETVVKYYQKILDILYERVPGRLTTFHLQPEADRLQCCWNIRSISFTLISPATESVWMLTAIPAPIRTVCSLFPGSLWRKSRRNRS